MTDRMWNRGDAQKLNYNGTASYVSLGCADTFCQHFVVVPESCWAKMRSSGATFWCPAGHPQYHQAHEMEPALAAARREGFDAGFDEGRFEASVELDRAKSLVDRLVDLGKSPESWDRVAAMLDRGLELARWVDDHGLKAVPADGGPPAMPLVGDAPLPELPDGREAEAAARDNVAAAVLPPEIVERARQLAAKASPTVEEPRPGWWCDECDPAREFRSKAGLASHRSYLHVGSVASEPVPIVPRQPPPPDSQPPRKGAAWVPGGARKPAPIVYPDRPPATGSQLPADCVLCPDRILSGHRYAAHGDGLAHQACIEREKGS